MLFPLQAVSRKLINVTSTTKYRDKWHIPSKGDRPFARWKHEESVALSRQKQLVWSDLRVSGCEITFVDELTRILPVTVDSNNHALATPFHFRGGVVAIWKLSRRVGISDFPLRIGWPSSSPFGVGSEIPLFSKEHAVVGKRATL